jgi:ankyrin repeat protein
MTVKTTRTRLKELSEGTDGYDKAYDEAMQRINAQLPEQQELAIKSLAWITFAKRSLTALELRHALAIEDGKSDLDEENIPRIKDVLSVCAGLLNTDGGIVHLVHYTAQEYFERTHTRWFAGFSETHISNLCVTYISFDSFGTGPSKTNQAFGKRIRKYPFYVYVAHHWGNHAREAQNCGPEVIRFLEDGAKLEASVQTLQTRRIPVYSRRSITTLVSGLFSRGTTGLHVAAYFDFHQLVNLLLQHHHILETRDSNSCTPLIWACNFARRDSMATINLLLASGAYIDAVNKYYETPLYLTASDGDEEAVQLLLDFGADINGNNENDPPLVVASEEGHLGVVNLLLSRGADPNRTGMEFPFGETPLERASSNGHLQIVELLLKEGADVTAHALKSAVSYGYEDVFEILLAKATSIPSPSAIYEAALCAASEKGNHSIVQTLLNKNTDVNAHYLWETPLIAASKGGQISMVQFLLVHGADVDENDDNYITALQEASCTGHLQIVKILLQHGANINQNGRRHGTALQAASGRGCLQIVEFLLQRGADPLIRGGPKKTALEAARWSRYENIVELLKKHIVEKCQRQVLDSVRLNSEVPQMDSIDSIVCE